MKDSEKTYTHSDLMNFLDANLSANGHIKPYPTLNLMDLYQNLSPRSLLTLDEDIRAAMWVPYSWGELNNNWCKINSGWIADHTENLLRNPGLCCVLASHGNGHVRETILPLLHECLAEPAMALLLIRANDWVPQVREEANQILGMCIKTEHLISWIRGFPLVERLLEHSRAEAPAWFPELENLLLAPEHQVLLQEMYPTLDNLSRKSLMRVIQQKLDDSAWLPILSKDPSLQVRRLLAEHAPLPFLFSLITDHDFKVREKAIQRIAQEATPEASRPVLLQALSDVRSGIRMLAQHLLKQKGEDVRPCYLQMVPRTLKEETGLAGGLADLGILEDLPLLETLSRSVHPPVRAEALRGLGRLSPVQYRVELEDAVLEVNRISRIAGAALKNAGLLSELGLQRLWSKAITAQQRKRLMRLTLHLPRYQAVAVLLEWRPRVNPEEGGQMIRQLQVLLKGYGVQYFLKPSADLRMRIQNSVQQQDLPRGLTHTLLDLSNH